MDGKPLDAIVIGAGAAGIGAAATLHAGSISRFVVLEATQRIGGRVAALTLGRSNPVQIENGANWISGAGVPPAWRHRAVNPLFQLALAVNMPIVRVPGAATNMSNWAVHDEVGNWVDIDHTRRNAANALKDCVARRGSVATANLSVATAAALCGWVARDGVDRSLEWQLFTGETGLPPEQMSAMSYLPDPTYEDFGPDDFFTFEQRPRGLARLLDAIADGALDGGHRALDQRLILGATVTRVHYACDHVVVTASDGRAWRARHVISTLPLGVLQRHGERLFAPRMPAAQWQAIRAIPMANYTKIFAQWDVPWWNVSTYKWAQANDGFNGGELGSVRNLAHPAVLPGSNALLFDLGDPQASVWEGLSDGEAQARLLKRLHDTHPGVPIPPPVAFHMTRHSRDPLTFGAYSAWGSSTAAEHRAARAPLAAHSPPDQAGGACEPRVWLSGEAFCANYNGFMHGGLLAGRRDARSVLAALGRPTNPRLLPGEDSSFGCDHATIRLDERRLSGSQPPAKR